METVMPVKLPVSQMTFTSGSYSPDETLDLLSALVKAEMDFHKLQNYRSQVMFDEDCETASKNLAHLKMMTEKIHRLVLASKKQHINLRVESVLHITVDEN
jgi:hypothetical protein